MLILLSQRSVLLHVLRHVMFGWRVYCFRSFEAAGPEIEEVTMAMRWYCACNVYAAGRSIIIVFLLDDLCHECPRIDWGLSIKNLAGSVAMKISIHHWREGSRRIVFSEARLRGMRLTIEFLTTDHSCVFIRKIIPTARSIDKFSSLCVRSRGSLKWVVWSFSLSLVSVRRGGGAFSRRGYHSALSARGPHILVSEALGVEDFGNCFELSPLGKKAS